MVAALAHSSSLTRPSAMPVSWGSMIWPYFSCLQGGDTLSVAGVAELMRPLNMPAGWNAPISPYESCLQEDGEGQVVLWKLVRAWVTSVCDERSSGQAAGRQGHGTNNLWFHVAVEGTEAQGGNPLMHSMKRCTAH